MEAVAFVLIGAALFSHAWYLLGLYPDGRTMGVMTGALGLGALIAITLPPLVLLGETFDTDANLLAETTVMKMLIIVWAAYAVGVAAQGIWDLEERALGFFAAIATAGSAVAFFFFAATLGLAYGDAVSISMSAATLALTVLGGMLFFHLAIPFNGLRLVAGWFILVGSVAVAAVGWAVMATLIEAS